MNLPLKEKQKSLKQSDKNRIVFSFTEAFRETRLRYPCLKNYNHYQVARAVLSVDILEKPLDISALVAFTGINRSTTYAVLNKLVGLDLITIYTLPNDHRRKYVKATEKLKSEFFNFLEDIEILIEISAGRLK